MQYLKMLRNVIIPLLLQHTIWSLPHRSAWFLPFFRCPSLHAFMHYVRAKKMCAAPVGLEFTWAVWLIQNCKFLIIKTFNVQRQENWVREKVYFLIWEITTSLQQVSVVIVNNNVYCIMKLQAQNWNQKHTRCELHVCILNISFTDYHH